MGGWWFIGGGRAAFAGNQGGFWARVKGGGCSLYGRLVSDFSELISFAKILREK